MTRPDPLFSGIEWDPGVVRRIADALDNDFDMEFLARYHRPLAEGESTVSALHRAFLETLAQSVNHEDVRTAAARLAEAGLESSVRAYLEEMSAESRQRHAAALAAGGGDAAREAMMPLATSVLKATLAQLAAALQWPEDRPQPARRGRSAGAPLVLHEAPYAPVSSGFVFYEAARALSQPELWQREEATPWPTMLLDGKEAHGHIQLVPPAIDGQSFRSPEERAALEAAMWRHRDGLSTRTRAVLRAVEILWRQRSRMNPNAPVTIKIDEILDAMNRAPKRGAGGRRSGHHAEARRAVVEELAVIQAVQIRATVTVHEKRKKTERRVLARLFLMANRAGDPQPGGSLDTQAVVVTPDGQYGHYLLTHQHMPYDTRLLAENPQTHGLVLGIVEALSEDWRRNGGDPRPRNWFGLLEEIGAKPYAKPNREIERAERLFSYITGNGYASSMDWHNLDTSQAYGHGASRLLADAAVIAEPPEFVRAKYGKAAIGRRSSTRPAPASRGDLAPRLTAARLSGRLTQAQAAEDAGIPQQTFSRAERGLGLSQENRRKLERWLARVAPQTPAE